MAPDIVTNGVNGCASLGDWHDRYYHVDQVLDRPGPRTDPSFLAGDEVSPVAMRHWRNVFF